jgi:hypothetical protein
MKPKAEGEIFMRRILALVIAIISLCGCQSIYKYKSAQYTSSEAALQAQRDDINEMIAEIKPTNNPLGGKALVVLPSRKLIESKVVKIFTSSPRREWVEYFVMTIELDNDAKAEVLKRRKIFEEVAVTKSDQPETVMSSDYKIIVYLKLIAYDQMQWYLRTSFADRSFPIYSDNSFPAGMQRTFSWLDYLEKTAAEQLKMGGK